MNAAVIILGHKAMVAFENADKEKVGIKELIYIETDVYEFENSMVNNKFLVKYLPEIKPGRGSLFNEVDKFIELRPILHLIDSESVVFVIASIDSEVQMKLIHRVMNFLKDSDYDALCLFEDMASKLYKYKFQTFVNSSLSEEFVMIQFPERKDLANNISLSLWHLNNLIYTPGLINLDYLDVKAVVEEGLGEIYHSVGYGKSRTIETIDKIIESSQNPNEVKKCIINIIGDTGLGIMEINEAAEALREALSFDVTIIFGIQFNESYDEEVHTMVIFS